ncbi:probable bifunctional dTTP/UTP pyrophosphatase/methyltransferase protein isoform X2 [Entelurus aequoreus]|uniref:probable bifunctional dTTP/UTP pyrophosphatase/methyltransferase protein isoform X2 n=1 Tax=Entelurus aequoreus TaxID=161455 RepID=UPI002B1E1F80|nr:probable bifunctional dTTP/UTP pyrophosphatase/methyltransferase protein isoform X2 [Entelurus aequoreus]
MVLNPVISKLAGKLVVLASASPRRLDILRNAGMRFEVVPSWFKETLDKRLFKAPQEYAVETAKQKALEVARRMPCNHRKTPDIVIGADTIVSVDGMILEKPRDKQDAYRMLSSLSGKEHSVFTGVAVILCHDKENEVDYQIVDFYEETKVKFADLSEDLLWEYIDSGEPMDKAGGYGIQALGGMLVEYVHGDFLNVVGFPLNHFCKQLDVIYNRPPSCCRGDAAPCPAPNQPPLSSSSTHAARPACSQSGETLPSTTSRGQLIHDVHLRECGDSEEAREDLQRIIPLMDGFKASKALFTASKMGVFDLLQHRLALNAAQVAQELKSSVKGTERLLEACVSLNLLKISKCEAPPVYENTDLAKRFLLSDAPWSLLGYMAHCDDTVWPLFNHLDSAVQEGANQHHKAFGKNPGDLFQDTVYSGQEVKLRFMKAMDNIAKVTGRAVATAFDLSAFKTACDLGGCTGAMAAEITRAHPGMSVTVFDLPTVIEMTHHFHSPSAEDRVTFVSGDFFKDALPKADLYILSRILHDWSDEKVQLLLGRIAEMCTPGRAVLIAETMLDERSPYSALQSLNMLVQTEGLERTQRQYADLLGKHGFGRALGVHTMNFLDAFIAFKL